MAKPAALVALLIAVPAGAWACQVCVEELGRFMFPIIPWIALVAAMWWVGDFAARIVHSGWGDSEPPPPSLAKVLKGEGLFTLLLGFMMCSGGTPGVAMAALVRWVLLALCTSGLRGPESPFAGKRRLVVASAIGVACILALAVSAFLQRGRDDLERFLDLPWAQSTMALNKSYRLAADPRVTIERLAGEMAQADQARQGHLFLLLSRRRNPADLQVIGPVLLEVLDDAFFEDGQWSHRGSHFENWLERIGLDEEYDGTREGLRLLIEGDEEVPE